MLYVCIPVHNEAATIGVLLWRIRTVLQDYTREYEVVVYDDGSTDDSVEVLEPYRRVLPLTVLRSPVRRGTAAALDALARHVVAHTRYPRRDGAVFMQGDFTDRPEDLPDVAKRFEGGADLIVGRRPPAPEQPLAERRLRQLAPWVLRPFVGVAGVEDLVTGFRVVRVSVLRDLVRAAGDAPLASARGWAAQVDFALAVTPFARRIEVMELPGRYDLRPRPSRLDWWRDLKTLAGYAWRARGLRVAPGTRVGERPERAGGRGERSGVPDEPAVIGSVPAPTAAAAPERPARPEAGRGRSVERSERPEREEREEREERGERGERPRRAERPLDGPKRERAERPGRGERSDGAAARAGARSSEERTELPARAARPRRERARPNPAEAVAGEESPRLEPAMPIAEADALGNDPVRERQPSDAVLAAVEAAEEAVERAEGTGRRKRKRRRRRSASGGTESEVGGEEGPVERDEEPGSSGGEAPSRSTADTSGAIEVESGPESASDGKDDGDEAAGGDEPAAERARRRRRRRGRGRKARGGACDGDAGDPGVEGTFDGGADAVGGGTEGASGVAPPETGVGIAASRASREARAAEGGEPTS